MHQAADGGLARVRLPGGVLSTDQLQVLAAASAELGDGNLELTSRANLQIRALRPGAAQALSDRLYSAGLLPSISHERVRNILASPLSGLDPHSLYDVLPAVAELDRHLCARPALAGLPGRFLFALDDGRGDLAGLGADVGIQALPDGRVALLLAGADTGVRVPREDLVPVMLAAAEAFLAERAAQGSGAWRLT
ncbi:MAG: precorrin-3B synthase, partial [Kribbellaceae bacterium]|nr:precorrin-3B synthase [Kribbellaceae bacterium]